MKIAHFFCAFGSGSYKDHDNLDHGYITAGYLDIDIKNNVYSNSRTPVNIVRVIICVHDTPAVTAGGKREETGKASEVLTHQRRAKKTKKTQDFTSNRNRSFHFRCTEGECYNMYMC
jgi:hypothetical protein